ncbi:ankyrin [Ustulina deusta]|nr:ankyrin [Ustulina deusta]
MDPSSVVGFLASIIQLIETTAKAISYVNDVKDAPTERAQFARHASSLLALLTDLRYRVEEAKSASEPWFGTLHGLGVKRGPLDQLEDQMGCLAMQLLPLSIGRFQNARKALSWTLDKKEIVEVLVQIERVKTLVMLALQNDQFKLTLAMKQDLMDVKEDLRKAIGEANAEREDEEFEKITSWLSSLDFTAKQTDFLKRRQAETGEWLLSDPIFQDWADGKERTLWCPGLREIGNTLVSVASVVIDWLEHQHRPTEAAVIYLYCSYKEEETQTPENMVGSLLKQLVQNRAVLPGDVRNLYTKHFSKKTRPRLDEFARLLVQEARIEEASLAKHVRSSSEIMEEITKTVVQTSQGMFLLAQLHMDSLARKLTRREVRAALRSLPKELDETYDQAMQRIQNQDEGQAALAHRVLYWISYSLRPLTLAELQHALAVELGDVDLDEDGLYETDLIASVCAGLVTVDRESNQIRLVHYTTQSYFERIRTKLFPEAPSTISKTCLTYLAFRPFAENYCLSEEELIARLAEYPFLSYAANYWGDHIRNGMDDDVHKLALEYLSNNIGILSACQAADDEGPSRYLRRHLLCGGMMPNITRLHMIALFGVTEIAGDLLADSVDVNAKAYWGMTPLHLAAEVAPEASSQATPLHMAAENGHEAVVQLLIEAGAECNARRGILGMSPLHFAAKSGHIDVTQVLIEKGADINQREVGVDCSNRHNSDEISDGDDFEGLGGTPLNRAAEQGHDDLVLLLLNNGADISATNQYGCTALHAAARDGYIKLVKLLIARGINISTMDENGRTALHYAAEAGEAGIIQILLESNADVLAEDLRGRTAVHEATENEHESILKILLERIGDENQTERWVANFGFCRAVDQADAHEVMLQLGKGADPNVKTKDRISLLHLAVVRENIDVLQLLLANGASANVKEFFNRTPLHWAAYRDYSTGVQLLLDYGADIQAAGTDGLTPLHMAAAAASFSVVNQLLDNGAETGCKGKGGVDGTEIHNKYLAVLDVFIERGADLNELDSRGSILLISAVASTKSTVALVRRLLEKGANVAAQTNSGTSALYLATQRRQLEVARLLLEYGADVNQKNKRSGSSISMEFVYGVTALHEAAEWGLVELAHLLIEAGADVEAVDEGGITVLHKAVMNYMGSTHIVELLLAHGVDIDAHYGNRKATALHHAATRGNIAMVRYLLEKGARIAATDINGKTALDWAKDTDHEAMMFFLRRYDT